MPAASPLVTVVVLTYNEESHLPDLFASLRDLDCCVVVVDSGSTDRTIEIAKSAGADVLHHPFEHYAAQRNWAQERLPPDADWVLHMDADEQLTPELAADIDRVLRSPPQGIDGFMVRKRTVFMGRWIRHGGHYPSYHLRLFRKALGRCEDRLYDQHFVVGGRAARLEHDLIDTVMTDLTTWSLRHIRWAELEAREMMAGQAEAVGQVQPRLFGNPIQRRRWLRRSVYARAPLFLRAWAYWAYRYFLRLGFLDGKEGLIFHFLQGCWLRFLTDAKLYEARQQQRAAKTADPQLAAASKGGDGKRV